MLRFFGYVRSLPLAWLLAGFWPVFGCYASWLFLGGPDSIPDGTEACRDLAGCSCRQHGKNDLVRSWGAGSGLPAIRANNCQPSKQVLPLQPAHSQPAACPPPPQTDTAASRVLSGRPAEKTKMVKSSENPENLEPLREAECDSLSSSEL